MSFGKMNEFIDIIEPVHNKDAAGFVITSENVVASVRAYKEYRHGNKVWANRAAFSTATVMFRFRVIPNLKIIPSYYIACLNEKFKILSVDNVRGRNMYVEVLAESVMPSKR